MRPLFCQTLLFGILIFSAAVQAQTIVLMTEENPPLNYTDSTSKAIVGTATELVKATFEKAGIPYSLRLVPWQRAYSSALDTPNTCVYSTTLTDERRPLFKWISPVAENVWLLVALEKSPIVLTSLNDAKKYRIGGYAGDAKTLFLEKQGLKVDIASSDELNLNKIQNDRIDLWAISETAASVSQAAKDGYFIRNNEKLKAVLKLQTVELGLACHSQLDADLHARLLAAFDVVRPRP